MDSEKIKYSVDRTPRENICIFLAAVLFTFLLYIPIQSLHTLWFLIMVYPGVWLGYFFGFRFIFGNKPNKGIIYNKNKLPHENYSEILLWDDGDIFKKYSSDWDCDALTCQIKSIHDNGEVVIIERKNKLTKMHIKKFLYIYKNDTVKKRIRKNKQRKIREFSESDISYNDFLKEYKKAYKEISG